MRNEVAPAILPQILEQVNPLTAQVLVTAVESPELDAASNYLAGVKALELLSERIGRSIFKREFGLILRS